jgi:hypothetical protein
MSKSRLIPVGVFKHDMRALVDWLRSHRIQQVAMESTGIYGKSVFSHVEPAGSPALVVKRRPGQHDRRRQ